MQHVTLLIHYFLNLVNIIEKQKYFHNNVVYKFTEVRFN